MKIDSIRQHAIERYMERTGTKKAKRAFRKLQAAEGAIDIGYNQFYQKGMIYVIVNGAVITAFKPRTQSQMDGIYRAKNPPLSTGT